MVYKEKYQEHLRELLANGGTPEVMEVVVNEYNAVEDPDWPGSEAFTIWSKGKNPDDEVV